MSYCNYDFINNLAYTEDLIVVYNLFIYKMSPKTTAEDCRQYLSRFGEIIKFRFNVKHINGPRKVARYAFVKYKNAENASSVLRNQKHTLSPGKTFYVKACDSWNQPKMTATSEQSKGHNSNQAEFGENVDANLLNLNEDCLMAILAYLPFEDQVSLARSHIDFEAIFKSYAKIHYKNIDSDKFLTMSLWNIRETFLLAGEFIERFHFYELYRNKKKERIISFVQSNCPNLREIFISFSKVRVTKLRKILTNKSHLTHVTFYETVTDSCIRAMKTIPTLVHLAIVYCDNFTGRHLHLLPQLKFLNLSHCSHLNSTLLLKALSAMPDLISLNIAGISRLHKSVIDALPVKNKNLKILRTALIADFGSIAHLPNLRCLGLSCDNFCDALHSSTLKFLIQNFAEKVQYLNIRSDQSVNMELWEMIAKFGALKSLCIYGRPIIDQYSLMMFGDLKNLVEITMNGMQSLTNKILLGLIRNCPLLKWIDVANTPIDNEFAKDLLPILKKEKRTNGRLIIWVTGTQIRKKDMPDEYKTAEIKSLIEFLFRYMSGFKIYNQFFDDFKKTYKGMELVGLFYNELFNSNSIDDIDNDDSDEDMLD